MRGTCLRFYVQEGRLHHHHLLCEWLLEQGKRMGLHGGSAFKAMAGFGRHGMLHEDHFYELAGKLPVCVEFIITDDEADRFLTFVQTEEASVFYVRFPVEYGLISGPGN